jgi:hypothetical protein
MPFIDRADIDRIKASIDLVGLAETYGYQQVPEESSRQSVKLKRGEENPVIIQRRPDGDVFFDTGHRSENGDAITFVRWQTGSGFLDACQRIMEFDGSPLNRPLDRASLPSSIEDFSQVRVRYERAARLTGSNSDYLSSRGLVFDEVSSRIRIDSRGNLLFPHFDLDGEFTGYEIKGPDYSGFSKGGRKSLYSTGATSPKRIVITESGLDCEAARRILGDPEALYVSTGGSLSPKQIKQLQGLCERSEAKLMIGVDPDHAGDQYAEVITEAVPEAIDIREKISGKDWNAMLLN